MKRSANSVLFIVLIAFLAIDILVWRWIAAGAAERKVYFLDVGQGDAELLSLGKVLLLVDAGPSAAVARELASILPASRRYIDIGIISHPETDHFGGFIDLMDRFEFGAFIVNGREKDTQEWTTFVKKAQELKIPFIVLQAGDAVRYGGDFMKIISPDPLYRQSGSLNDTSLVGLAEVNGLKILLTGDIGAEVENYLAAKFDLRADILKIPHHGSKYSSGEAFLRAVQPFAAIVEVGKNNYGHPTPEFLGRAKEVGIAVFETAKSGTIEVSTSDGKLYLREI